MRPLKLTPDNMCHALRDADITKGLSAVQPCYIVMLLLPHKQSWAEFENFGCNRTSFILARCQVTGGIYNN